MCTERRTARARSTLDGAPAAERCRGGGPLRAGPPVPVPPRPARVGSRRARRHAGRRDSRGLRARRRRRSSRPLSERGFWARSPRRCAFSCRSPSRSSRSRRRAAPRATSFRSSSCSSRPKRRSRARAGASSSWARTRAWLSSSVLFPAPTAAAARSLALRFLWPAAAAFGVEIAPLDGARAEFRRRDARRARPAGR